jgi:CHAT domain-containing protein
MLYQLKHEYSRAEAYQLRSLDIRSRVLGLEHDDTLLSVMNLAKLYFRVPDKESRADQLVNWLLSVGGDRPSKRHMGLANLIAALAADAQGNFQLGLAERLAARAVALYRAAAGPTAPKTMDTLRLLAVIQAAKGDWQSAESIYTKLLNLYDDSRRAEAADLRIQLGKVFLQRGKHSSAAALSMFQSAVSELRQLNPQNKDLLASALGNLGRYYFLSDQAELAEKTYREALALFAHEEKNSQRTWLLYNQGMLGYHLGRYDDAVTSYQQAKTAWAAEHSPDHPFVATAAANLALVYWAQGDFSAAVKAFAEANAIHEHEARVTLLVGSERARLAHARGMQDNLFKMISLCFAENARTGCTGEAADITAAMLLQRKGRVLDAMADTLAQMRSSMAPEDTALLYRLDKIRTEISELTADVIFSRAGADYSDKLRKLQTQEEELQSTLSHKSAFYRSRLAPVTVDTVRNALPADGVLIEFLNYAAFDPKRTGKFIAENDDRYAALVLGPQSRPQLFDLGPAQSIETTVAAFRLKLRNMAAGVDVEATELHRLLIRPLNDALAGARLMLIAPDGPLNLIPFTLLTDEKDGRSLGQRFVVNYLNSGRELLRPEGAPAPSPMVVVVANPDFDAEPGETAARSVVGMTEAPKLATLEETHLIVEKIASLFTGIVPLEGARASIDTVKGLKHPAILHIATHGVFAPFKEPRPEWNAPLVLTGGDQALLLQLATPSALANPMLYSGLALAGANRTVDGKRRGILTALEIATTDLNGTQLVVLSACDTGLGTAKQGEEFAGLRRALSMAGAASQVTSLWKVDEEATRLLMTRYYELLLNGHGRAEALKLAQELMAQESQWEHPFYWAGFVPSGDWRPLNKALDKLRKTADNR